MKISLVVPVFNEDDMIQIDIYILGPIDVIPQYRKCIYIRFQ